MRVGDEVFHALGDPRDRPAEPLRRNRAKRIFPIGKKLRSETAADVGRDHMQTIFGNAQDGPGKYPLHRMGALAAEGQHEAFARRVVLREHRPRVEIIGDEALVDERERYGLRRVCERRRRLCFVAKRLLIGEIAGTIGPYQRRARLDGCDRIDDMRQRFPIDFDGFGRVLRLVKRVGDDDGDGVADVTRDVADKDRVFRRINGDPGRHAEARQRPKFSDVGGRQDQANARHGARRVDIDAVQARVRVGRADHHRTTRIGRNEIGNITPISAEERVILLAGDGLRNAELHPKCSNSCASPFGAPADPFTLPDGRPRPSTQHGVSGPAPPTTGTRRRTPA